MQFLVECLQNYNVKSLHFSIESVEDYVYTAIFILLPGRI